MTDTTKPAAERECSCPSGMTDTKCPIHNTSGGWPGRLAASEEPRPSEPPKWEFNGLGEIFCDGSRVAIAGAAVGSPRIDDTNGVLHKSAEWITSACNVFEASSIQAASPSDELNYLRVKVQDADKVMAEIDRAVKADLLSSRSAIADARQNYGEPFTEAASPAGEKADEP